AMPLIVRDREFVTHVYLSADPTHRIGVIRSEPAGDEPSVKPNKKIIRGTLASYYELKSIDDGKRTLLTIELHSDPKGMIPAWVVNLFQKDWARETIAGIRRQVKKRLTAPRDFVPY